MAARTPKKVLQMAGIEDCYTCSRGSTRTLVSLAVLLALCRFAAGVAAAPMPPPQLPAVAAASLLRQLHCFCRCFHAVAHLRSGVLNLQPLSHPPHCRLTPRSPPPPPPLPLQGNFVKATFYALANTYGFLTPDLWRETVFTKSPLQEYSDFLAKVRGGRQ